MKITYKNIIYILIISCSMSVSLYGQNNQSPNDTIDYKALSDKLYGTYQIEMIDTRTLPSFPAELLEVIEAKREEDNIVYHNVSDIMRIKILPNSIIDAADFVPIKRINYITSKDL